MDKLLFFISLGAFAGSGDAYGPSSLISPMINTLLVGVIFFSQRKKIRSYFTGKYNQIKEVSERAKTQKFEAEMLLEKQQKKNDKLDETIAEIEMNAKKEVENFKSTKEKENASRVSKLEEDFGSKLEMKKLEMVKNINKELIESVIAKAKDQVKNNPELASKINSSITQGL